MKRLALIVLATGCSIATEPPNDPPPETTCGQWNATVVADAPSRRIANGIVPLGQQLGAVGDRVDLIDLSTTPPTSNTLSLPTVPGELLEVEQAGDGAFLIAGAKQSSSTASGRALWLGLVRSDGSLDWERTVSPLHYMAWVHVDVRLHPAGGFVVSSHDGPDDGNRLITLRIDDLGQTLWSRTDALAADADVAEGWSKGAMDLLPDGDIVQLTAGAGGLRVLRTSPAGEVLWDNDYPTGAWPQDVVALPDGDILVLSLSFDGATLHRLHGDGSVVWKKTYREGPDSGLNAMAWDPDRELLLAMGGTRGTDAGPKNEWKRSWMLLVDGDGVVQWDRVGLPGTNNTALDVVSDPSADRFFFSMHGEGQYIGALEFVACPVEP